MLSFGSFPFSLSHSHLASLVSNQSHSLHLASHSNSFTRTLAICLGPYPNSLHKQCQRPYPNSLHKQCQRRQWRQRNQPLQ